MLPPYICSCIQKIRQKKARALYHKERLEQEIIAREKYYVCKIYCHPSINNCYWFVTHKLMGKSFAVKNEDI